jgi:hypothetical protein
MNESADYRVGDWICFMTANGLVISEIRYVTDGILYINYITDAGTVHESDVLECRSKEKSC